MRIANWCAKCTRCTETQNQERICWCTRNLQNLSSTSFTTQNEMTWHELHLTWGKKCENITLSWCHGAGFFFGRCRNRRLIFSHFFFSIENKAAELQIPSHSYIPPIRIWNKCSLSIRFSVSPSSSQFVFRDSIFWPAY